MQKKTLKNIFNRVVKTIIGVAVTPFLLYGAFILTFYTGRGQKPSPCETQLLKDAIGATYDPSGIRTHFHSKAGMDYKIIHAATSFFLGEKNAYAMPLTKHIVLFDDPMARPDCTKDIDADIIGHYAHEAYHTRQFTTRDMTIKGWGDYALKLVPGKKFDSYGFEQQACFFEEYIEEVWMNKKSVRTEAESALLVQVVEEKFPAARETRLKIEAGKIATGRADFSWRDLYPDQFPQKIEEKKSEENGAVKKTRTSTGRPATTSR